MGHFTSEIAQELEVAVRGRLSHWTQDGLDFAQLDIPCLLNSAVTQQLIDRPDDIPEPGSTVDDAAMVAYLSELDLIANPSLQGAGTVTPSNQQLTHSFRSWLDRARPLDRPLSVSEQTELTALTQALYQGEDHFSERTAGYDRYLTLKSAVLDLAVSVSEAEAEHGPDDPAVARLRFQHDMAQTDLATIGNAQYYESVKERIADLTEDLDVRWSDLRRAYEAGQIQDAQTHRKFAVTSVQKIPASHWQTVRITPANPRPGEFLGIDEVIEQIDAELFVVPINRSAWFDEALLTSGAWEWAMPGVDTVISDGKGFGEMANIPKSMVLLRKVQIKAKVPTSSFEDPAKTVATIPKLGRMVMPFQVKRVDGVASKHQAVVAQPAKLAATVQTLARTGSLKERRMQMMRAGGKQTRMSRDVLSALRKTERKTVAKAKSAPQKSARVLPKVALGKSLRIGGLKASLKGLRPSAVATQVKISVSGRSSSNRPVIHFVPKSGGPPTAVKVIHDQQQIKLRPGDYRVTVSGLPEDSIFAPMELRVSGASTNVTIPIKPKWKTMELSAFDEGAENGAVIFGYLVRQMPMLPKESA